MNNTTYLKQQYQKISKKLHKAFTTGRFYQYTQYKQQRLLDKFSNYSLQLRKLGVAVAIGAGVSMAAPVQGQTPLLWQENLGTSNPLDMDTLRHAHTSFVDLDADGDMDIIANVYDLKNTGGYTYTGKFRTIYYENTGTVTSPNFIKGVTPFPSGESVTFPSFVDIDNDGDLDAFSGSTDYYTYGAGEKSVYFENVGNATSPLFTKRTGTLNPLDSINSHYPFISISTTISFVDIDTDGDFDVFHQELDGRATLGASTVKQVLYRNTGNATNPVFTRDTLNNPWTDSLPISFGAAQFVDLDGDNDLDILKGDLYFENTGNPSVALYERRTQAPQNLFANMTKIQHSSVLVDIDGDNDLDLFGYRTNNHNRLYRDTIVFLENITPSFIVNKYKKQIELAVFPNPTTGMLQLEQPLTGTLEVFNTLGQVLHTEQLEQQQQLNVGHLDSGNYIIKIQTADGILNEKIVLKK